MIVLDLCIRVERRFWHIISWWTRGENALQTFGKSRPLYSGCTTACTRHPGKLAYDNSNTVIVDEELIARLSTYINTPCEADAINVISPITRRHAASASLHRALRSTTRRSVHSVLRNNSPPQYTTIRYNASVSAAITITISSSSSRLWCGVLRERSCLLFLAPVFIPVHHN